MTIEEVVAAVSSEVGRDVAADTKLTDLGLDSLEFIDLMLVLNIPDSTMIAANTVRDLAA